MTEIRKYKTIAEVEKEMIIDSLARHRGNVHRTARELGLSRPALYRRLDKYNIQH